MVGETFRFTVFRSLEDAFVNPLSWHDLIISRPHVEQPLINLPKNVFPPVDIFFGKKPLHTLGEGTPCLQVSPDLEFHC